MLVIVWGEEGRVFVYMEVLPTNIRRRSGISSGSDPLSGRAGLISIGWWGKGNYELFRPELHTQIFASDTMQVGCSVAKRVLTGVNGMTSVS